MSATRHFGTDGVRGKVGDAEITPAFFAHLGWALGKTLDTETRPKVVIGKDTRISGYMLETALQSGLIAAGVDVLLLGPMPTPAVAWLTHTMHASAGLMISASHNPYYDNGLKIFDGAGRKLGDAKVREVENLLKRGMDTVASRRLGKVRRVDDAGGRYIEHCKGILPDDFDLGGMSIALDCAHGATYDVAPRLFAELGAEVVTMGVTPDGLNINERCGSIHPDALRRLVVERKADLGVTFDGDGDRALMVDRTGKLIDGDQMLFVLATSRAADGGGDGVIGTVMSNIGLERAMAERRIPFARADVGDIHVQNMMRERGWTLGGEPSGHIICAEGATTGDGVVAALHVLAALRRRQRTLDRAVADMPRFPCRLINVPGRIDGDIDQLPEIAEAVEAAKRELGGRGRVLLRRSGTEAVIRVMVEGEDAELIGQLAESIAESVAEVCES